MISQGGLGVDKQKLKGYSRPDHLSVTSLLPFLEVEERKSSWKTRVTQGPCPGFGAFSLQYVIPRVRSCFHYERNWTSSQEAVGLSLDPTASSLGALGHHFCHLCKGSMAAVCGAWWSHCVLLSPTHGQTKWGKYRFFLLLGP